MPIRDTGAEQLIKDTAKHIFFAEGRLHANTQDIADAAGVSRTLLNYYFRTKDVLIEQVFREAMLALTTRLDAVMASDQPFKKKIESFIDLFLTESNAYPYQETFLITEINSNTCKYAYEIKPHHISMFLEQIEAEMAAGNIEKMNPMHFVLNLFSLMSYPLIMSPIYKKSFNLSDESYTRLIVERKKMICKMIFR
ncbi:TetR/AcrR family transcriptional regulator [Mucilaginibacter sp. Mucisp86]|uniref:TetR/AcrR family transcriptional regulator n=1 Tax=Mucilaginibacter sp. Mucisp86 TaxID=3243060 RepID=UPI0039B3807E